LREAIYVLLKRGPAPPPVYQSQYDPKALINALKVFVWREAAAMPTNIGNKRTGRLC
jgi:hypothetical protein